MSGWFKELSQRDPGLYRFGLLNFGLFVLAMVMYLVDHTQVMGINAWIKPMKFALSISIYSWTYAWLLGYSEDQKANRLIRMGLIITMTAEIALIYLQAFRGTTSHFNIHTPFDGVIFGVMGFFIAINSLISLYTVVIFFGGNIRLSGASLWAWRSGLILFFLGGISGGWMVQHLAHTVGAPDGGPGLPFLNWSTLDGDIRPAHFVTLHALQCIPIAAFVLESVNPTTARRWTAVVIILYTVLSLYLHLLALKGIPVIQG